jgi:hypothetical protein
MRSVYKVLKKTCVVAAAVAGLLVAGSPAFANSCGHHISSSCKPSNGETNYPGGILNNLNVSDINVSDIDVSVLDLLPDTCRELLGI